MQLDNPNLALSYLQYSKSKNVLLYSKCPYYIEDLPSFANFRLNIKNGIFPFKNLKSLLDGLGIDILKPAEVGWFGDPNTFKKGMLRYNIEYNFTGKIKYKEDEYISYKDDNQSVNISSTAGLLQREFVGIEDVLDVSIVVDLPWNENIDYLAPYNFAENPI